MAKRRARADTRAHTKKRKQGKIEGSSGPRPARAEEKDAGKSRASTLQSYLAQFYHLCLQ